MRPIHLTTSAAVREKRLAALLDGRDPRALGLDGAVRDAQIAGSLELSGLTASRDERERMFAAWGAVDPAAPLSAAALQKWHGALGLGSEYRSTERTREGALQPSPPAFIGSRLAVLEQWLNVDSSRELQPVQAGALVLARVVEILPFEDGNGRVARLAASHVMVRAGGRPPILTGADGPRLREALAAAFQLATEPLAALLTEAGDRTLDVMIAALEG